MILININENPFILSKFSFEIINLTFPEIFALIFFKKTKFIQRFKKKINNFQNSF